MITNPSRAAAPTAVTLLRPARAIPLAAPRASREAPHGGDVSRRRIWQLDAARAAVIAGAILRLEDAAGADGDAAGDAAAWTELVSGSCVRGAVAEELEAALDRRTHRFAALVEERPMIEVADWWSRRRETLGDADVAALLWCLSRDPRPHLEKLASRVAADLCVRLVRPAAGGERDGATVRTAVRPLRPVAPRP